MNKLFINIIVFAGVIFNRFPVTCSHDNPNQQEILHGIVHPLLNKNFIPPLLNFENIFINYEEKYDELQDKCIVEREGEYEGNPDKTEEEELKKVEELLK